MLAVSSRLSTALIADRVAVLGEGRIIAQGMQDPSDEEQRLLSRFDGALRP
jgi:ABC-type transport system involved in Fe-S cluster assembly fused permease/ATPase subunit